jgi:hypothetical protein
MSDKDKIKDNPTCAKLLKNAQGMDALSKVVVFFEKLGIKNKKISEAFRQVPNLVNKTQELINMPDRFNEHFSKTGWIAYESLDFELMSKAVKLDDEGKLVEANELIVEHYNEDTLKWGLTFMKALEEYRIRDHLAQKAKEDYLEGRYHACVPVVLTIIDGIVNDVEQKGFFAEGVDLTAWDSIAAHSTGLQELIRLFNCSRKKTTTEKITVPYRHGILHGRDLGFDNKIVAAKTWATLFAIRDWALAIRQGKKHPKEKEPEPSFIEVLKSYAKTQEQKKKLEAWKPRVLTPVKDFPEVGLPEDYENNSPEYTLSLFLHYWAKSNYGKMAPLIKNFVDAPLSKRAGEIREHFQGKILTGFKFLKINDLAAAMTEISLELNIQYEERSITKEIGVKIINEDQNGNPVIRGEPGGNWLMIENSLIPIYSII